MPRALLLAAWTAGLYVCHLAARALALAAPRLGLAARARVLRAWARGVARVLGMRVVVEGEPPRPPFLLVSNHLSYVDIVALWTVVEGDFLARADVAGWPVFGFLARSAGTRFVDRSRKRDLTRVMDELAAVLARRRGAIVFPEATSSCGESVLPFRPSLFEVALRTGYPVRCAAISYSTPPGAEPARTSVCWWGDMTFHDHLYRLLALPSLEARIAFPPGAVEGADRKELALRAREVVAAAFRPVTGSDGPAPAAPGCEAREGAPAVR